MVMMTVPSLKVSRAQVLGLDKRLVDNSKDVATEWVENEEESVS
jgi:hypothetical protein